MTLASAGLWTNVVKSVQKHVQDNLQGSTGFPTDFTAAEIHWQGQQFDSDKVDKFLRVTLRDSAGSYGGGSALIFKTITLFLDVFAKREYLRQANDWHKVNKALDTIAGVYHGKAIITIKNYDGDGNTTLGTLAVRRRQPNVPIQDAWSSGGWMIALDWIQSDATA
jgi:hypothetical protein